MELLVATSLMLIVMSSVFQTLHPVHGAFRTEPEAADLQQRLRVAADALYSDLLEAGNGLNQGSRAGPLTDFLAPILPLRQGRRNADAAGTYKTSTITMLTLDARRGTNDDRAAGSRQVNDCPFEPRSGLPAGESELRLQGRHLGRGVRRHRRLRHVHCHVD